MPTTKDTPKYASLLLTHTGDAELVAASDVKTVAIGRAVDQYSDELEAVDEAEVDKNSDKYVEPAWDLYVREREVDKLISALRRFLPCVDVSEATPEEIANLADIKAQLHNLGV